MELDKPTSTNDNASGVSVGASTPPPPPPITTNNNNNNTTNNGSNNNTTNNSSNQNNDNGNTSTSKNAFPGLKSTYDIDVIRIIGQHLVNLGLKKTADQLMEESGIHGIDHPLATRFQHLILAGDWDAASALIEDIVNLVITTINAPTSSQASSPDFADQSTTASTTNAAAAASTNNNFKCNNNNNNNNNGARHQPKSQSPTAIISNEFERISKINQMKLLVAEQKFLELIDDKQHIKALKCLRVEVTPLINDIDYVQNLATFIMCKSTDEVRQKANWPGKGLQSRQHLLVKLQRFIPPLIMLPPKRLNTLLDQAIQLQKERCTFHPGEPTAANEQHHQHAQGVSQQTDHVDLKTDHVCLNESFPLQTRQELDSHKAEVWFCKFSNDGTKLATGGLGGKVKIWNLDPVEKKLNEKCTLDCHSYSITCLSWSPNDVYLLACGSEERPDLWIWNVNKEEVHNMISHSDDEYTTTCSWHLSGEKFAAGSIKGNFNIFDLDGHRRGTREGVRVQCLSFLHKDPDYILAADTLNRIKSYAIKDMSLESDEEDILEERYPIMSFTVDSEDKYVAINLMEQGIHLWDLKLKILVRMFPGVVQRHLTIYSSFSSPSSTFLASGSEDGKVYIYNTAKDQPIAILDGHLRCVNCVSWNPRYPGLMVSVSDDRTVRLWASADS